LHVGSATRDFLTSSPVLFPKNFLTPYSFLNSFSSNGNDLRILISDLARGCTSLYQSLIKIFPDESRSVFMASTKRQAGF